MYHLDIIEKDYFGLRFMDSAQVPVRILTYVLFSFFFFLMLLFVTVCYCLVDVTENHRRRRQSSLVGLLVSGIFPLGEWISCGTVC